MSRYVPLKLLLLCMLYLTGCTALSSTATETADQVSQEAAYPSAPDFKLLTFGGGEVHLSDYQGKYLLLSFWSSWCTYCQEELPLLQKMQEQYGDVLQVVAVNLTYQDDREEAKRFVVENQLEYPIALDRFGEVSKLYGVVALPTLYIISPQGELLQQLPGVLEEEALVQELEAWF